ncbi:MAG TPA: efflux RND transporter permease subunit [Gemmatimonadaceae bacterium]|nr:efflux RND transporter permease subunit [Gemmatimonadaceae bacterium]
MVISDFAIKRPIITVVVMIILVTFGIAGLFELQTDEYPDIQAPIVFVAVGYPGASPETVEREVLDRAEDKISGISGVDRIESTATDGFATILVTFVFQKDIMEATQDIRDAFSEIRNQLPVEVQQPIIQRFDPDQLPIVSLTLTSTALNPAQLTQLADPGISGDLRSIPGVAQVNVSGADSAQLVVQLRPEALQAAGVSAPEVVQALEAQNLAAPVGRVNGALEEQTIRLEGRLQRPEDFLQLAVATRGGQVVRLGQVADVSAGHAETRSIALYNGKQAIGLDIVKSKGFSTTAVSDAVKARVAQLQKTLPPGTSIEVVRDAGARVRNSVHNVEEALVEGAILTVLVVFLFLNSWRSTVITGLALPVSVLASFIAVWIFGFTLNTMSLLGLSLAIGLLIDDAIVVRENIVRHIEMGEDHYEASRTGTSEIGLAVAATTFSIIAVFAPIAFMSGLAGQWFKPFALTIACAVLVSLFVSFSLDPMLSAYWADPQTEKHEHRNWLSRALDAYNRWFNRQADRYRGVIAWALDHRFAMVGIAVVAFVGAVVLQVAFGGFAFAPVSDESELNIAIETPPGSNIDYTRIKAEEIARIIRAHPEVEYTYTTIGTTSGSGVVDEGNIYARLVPKGDRNISQGALGEIIRAEMSRVAGVTAYTYTSGFGGNQKQIQIQVTGPDANELTSLAQRIEDVARTVPGATDFGLSTKGQKPELDVRVDRGLAGALGLTVGQIAQALRSAFAGVDAGTWVDPSGETRYVHVRFAPESRQNAADLRQLPLIIGNGPAGVPTVIQLGQVATVTAGVGPAQINHLNRKRVVTMGSNVAAGYSLGNVSQEINARVAQLSLPAGYQISQGGQVRDQNQVFVSVFAALGIALMLMYLILVIQFGSFLDPVAIMLSLPLSLIGVVLALLVTHDTLNIMSLIGVILLMGIVAKNAILLIDFAKWGQERGMSRREAIIEAGRIRLRPIMMTTLALIAGMFPVALGIGEGADFRAPLGRAVIGGVITSTILTLVVIPTVYEILDEWKEGLLARFGRRAHGEGVGVTPVGEPEAGD